MKPRENFNLKEGIVYMFTLFTFHCIFSDHIRVIKFKV